MTSGGAGARVLSVEALIEALRQREGKRIVMPKQLELGTSYSDLGDWFLDFEDACRANRTPP